MSDLRVPTTPLDAKVLFAGGQGIRGRFFVPAAAHNHDGPTRAEEWMNEAPPFFPFQAEGGGVAFLLNKREIVALSVQAVADAGDVVEGSESPTRRIVVEAEGQRFEGTVVIDMPETKARVLDYFNRPEAFLTLRDGTQHHLVQKARITRVIEIQED